MYIFKSCAAIWQDFRHPKIRCWHTQLNVCEKEEFQCFLYLIQIFVCNLFIWPYRYSSTDYQTTNYGLGGLCETHLDPAGFVRGQMKMHKDEFDLKAKGITYK